MYYLRNMASRFIVKAPNPAIVDQGLSSALVEIPENSTITLIGSSEDDERFVTVQWDGKAVQIFEADLKTHCEVVSAAT